MAKVKEKLEIGKRGLSILLENDLRYTSLNPLCEEVDYGLDAVRKYVEQYVEHLAVLNPEAEELALYYRLVSAKKEALNKQRNSDSLLKEILAFNDEQLREYAKTASTNDLTKLNRLAMDAQKNKPQGYEILIQKIDQIKTYRSEENVKKQAAASKNNSELIKKRKLEETKKIIIEYLDSSYIEIDSLNMVIHGFTTAQLNKYLEELKDYDEDGAKLYKIFMQTLESRRATVLDVIKQVATYINEGIEKNGNLEKFNMYDFYMVSSFDLSELIRTGNRLVRLGRLERIDLSALQNFESRYYSESFKLNMETAMDYKYTENNHEITDEEKKALIAHMVINNVPLTKATYNGAYHEYICGRIQIKQI